MDVKGTENAYVSGRGTGKSIMTTSYLKHMSKVEEPRRRGNEPGSSSSTSVRSSILTNLSHSAWPFSLSNVSGSHANKYVGFTASYTAYC